MSISFFATRLEEIIGWQLPSGVRWMEKCNCLWFEKRCLAIAFSSCGFLWRPTKSLEIQSCKSISTDNFQDMWHHFWTMVAYIIKVRKPTKICRFGTIGAVLLPVKKVNCHQIESHLMYQMAHFWSRIKLYYIYSLEFLACRKAKNTYTKLY